MLKCGLWDGGCKRTNSLGGSSYQNGAFGDELRVLVVEGFAFLRQRGTLGRKVLDTPRKIGDAGVQVRHHGCQVGEAGVKIEIWGVVMGVQVKNFVWRRGGSDGGSWSRRRPYTDRSIIAAGVEVTVGCRVGASAAWKSSVGVAPNREATIWKPV